MANKSHPQPFLVSACLVGMSCRYDGASKPLDRLSAENTKVLPLCPEVAGGLGVPREAASIQGGDGYDVLDGRARVVTRSGRDVTDEFIRGARAVLSAAEHAGVQTAILKQRSPSCGVGQLLDRSGSKRGGDGVTTALLRRSGITVISEEEWNSNTR